MVMKKGNDQKQNAEKRKRIIKKLIEKKIIKFQQRYALRGKVGCKMEKLETLPLRIKNKIDKLGLSGMIKFAVKRLWGKSL